MRVLAFMDYYLPGFRAGGPIRAVANLAEALAGDVQFRIFTRDHDASDPTPYPGVQRGEWHAVGAAEVMYAAASDHGLVALARFLRATEYDALYLNSFFSRFSMRVLLLRRLGLSPGVPLLLAPRGEFAAGALALKRGRKRAYLALASRLGLCRGIVWQASSAHEAEDIQREVGALTGETVRVFVTPELASPAHPAGVGGVAARAPKEPGRLRAVFVSRLSRMKNLDGVLRVVAGVRSHVDLDVYGPLEDAVYWSECQRLVADLPSNIRFRYHGEVPHEEVARVLARSDLFFLPTHGENFGHAILEALAAGTPVLVSDRTRWRGLEARGVGWDIPLQDVDGFRRVIDHVAAMAAEEHAALSSSAAAFARAVAGDTDAVEANRQLFRSLENPARRPDAASGGPPRRSAADHGAEGRSDACAGGHAAV
jgi:glycosyltransferase involved in cell wall biosynthesis